MSWDKAKNNLLIVLTIGLIFLIALLLYFLPNGIIFQGLAQIVGGYVGGYIALVGVIVTLEKQREISDTQWMRQLELSREEWKRQDSRTQEELLIKAQPCLELYNINSSNRVFLHLEDHDKLFSGGEDNEHFQ
jgi:hypothetical protein